MSGMKFIINRQSRIYLNIIERTNLKSLYKAVRDVLKEDEYYTDSLTITKLIMIAKKRYNGKYVNHLTLRRLVYLLIGRGDLKIRQIGMARVIWINNKLKRDVEKAVEKEEKKEEVKN